MPSTNNKNTTTKTSKTNGSKNSKKSSAGLVNSMPPVPKARERAKSIDAKRRGDAESNGL